MGWGWDDLIYGIPTGGLYNVYKHGYKEPADDKKAGLDTLSSGLRDLGAQQQAFQMEGMNKALDQYKGTDATYKALYGDPSSLSKAKYKPTGGV